MNNTRQRQGQTLMNNKGNWAKHHIAGLQYILQSRWVRTTYYFSRGVSQLYRLKLDTFLVAVGREKILAELNFGGHPQAYPLRRCMPCAYAGE